MGFNSVERMLRNVVQRMKSENYNGFHASAVMVLQIVLERSLEIKQAYLKWTMVEFRGVDLCTERDQMQCEMLDCRGGHDATEAKSQKLAGAGTMPTKLARAGTMPPKFAGAGTMPPGTMPPKLAGAGTIPSNLMIEACRGGHDATKACKGGHDATEACV